MSSNRLDELMGRANQAHAGGRFDECVQLCEEILASQPKSVPVLVLAGISMSKEGNAVDAAEYFSRAVLADPACAPAHLWLAMALRPTGGASEAAVHARRAMELNPGDPIAQYQLGLCLLDLGDPQAAFNAFAGALRLAPNVAMLHFAMGSALQGLRKQREAIEAYRHAARLDPASVSTYVALREALMDEGDFGSAAQTAKEVVRLNPESAEANLWVARALTEDARPKEAEPFLRRGTELPADTAFAHTLLGWTHQAQGDLAEAEKQFKLSVDELPSQGAAYLAITTNRKIRAEDGSLVERMGEQARSGKLPAVEQSQLQYALGKALEDLAEYGPAMESYDEANRLSYSLKFGSATFDPKSLDGYDETARIFSREFLERNRGTSLSTLPIVVIGMIRSGTTLAEQILSSHPLVGGAGEQRFWLDNGMSAIGSGGSRADELILRRLGDRYERLLSGIAPGKAHVVDKMPMNYQAIGLIHLAFPNVKFVHMVRHPVDTTLSIWATPNRVRLPWAHKKPNIVIAYQRYLKLMDHWRTVLPPGTMLDLRYEDVVAEPEAKTRDLIEFCGLEWDDACLRPEQNVRSVVTPSAVQVRQPVYKSSVERWRRFEPWLGELKQLL